METGVRVNIFLIDKVWQMGSTGGRGRRRGSFCSPGLLPRSCSTPVCVRMPQACRGLGVCRDVGVWVRVRGLRETQSVRLGFGCTCVGVGEEEGCWGVSSVYRVVTCACPRTICPLVCRGLEVGGASSPGRGGMGRWFITPVPQTQSPLGSPRTLSVLAHPGMTWAWASPASAQSSPFPGSLPEAKASQPCSQPPSSEFSHVCPPWPCLG